MFKTRMGGKGCGRARHAVIPSARFAKEHGEGLLTNGRDGPSDSHGDRHGPLSDCPIQIAEKLVIEYMETSEVSPTRKTMEQRYGKKNLRKLAAKYKEDRANREWLEKSTVACPSCHVHVEKSMGCNHVSGSASHPAVSPVVVCSLGGAALQMTCSKCKQHFCYRCGSKLMAGNPYEHFSKPGGPCYYQLFDGEPMEGFIWV
jgi:E3 ubiquitin-protein ligase RNF14